MEELTKLLTELEWKKQSRYNVSKKPYEGFVLGKVKCWHNKGRCEGHAGKKITSNTTLKPKYSEIYKQAKKLMEKHDPNFKFTTMQFNKNSQMLKHRDANNTGESYIIGLGKYTGGDLIIYDEKDDNKIKQKVNIKNRFKTFDGSLLPHEVAPFNGLRFSIVYFK